MRPITLSFIPLILAACHPVPDEPTGTDRVARVVVSADGDVGSVAGSHNAFSWELFAELSKDNEENIFFSPLSVTSALSLTMAGARGNTLDEMHDVLNLSLADNAWHGALGALTRDLNGDFGRGYTLQIANKLFGQSGYPFEAPFLEICDQDYGAPLQEWDFESDPEGGRVAVNDWVADQTNDLIVDLLPPGSVDQGTRLVLANAIYFLGDWATPFDPEDTRTSAFALLDGSSVSVPQMHLDTGDFEEHGIEFGFTDDVSIARLPYADDELSMVLLVPKTNDGLLALEAGLTGAIFEGYLDTLTPAHGLLSLPKLELEYEHNLVGPLGTLGLHDAFDSNIADFSGIADTEERLFITGIFHKAFVSIDEAGTEAAAATGVVVGNDSLPPSVFADHPFLFVIRDDLTGSVLFIGRVTDPS